MRSNLDIFSDDQAITADAASTNYVDVGKFAGKGEPIEMMIRVTTSFNNLTSLHVSVTECDTVDGTYTDVMSGPEVLAASLVAGYVFKFKYLPKTTDRYIKLHYDVTGTAPTAGAIAAEIVAPGGVDDSYEDGLYFSPRNTTGAAASA